ncbi:lipolysis-stimulated lipoprotein receptor isoform X1 [Ornithorhynchus anatinus]|uniref:lipolysis-stimulated lipoprotein receptor isoform X1 n=1 Tax=Ornithorhynchus anatinus TaxID=9258 RepID=UPI0010A7DB29|nr:lipolysis-stimulated lipoprotein receptor isoform X1 [Ornithorhynchus anatinus]
MAPAAASRPLPGSRWGAPRLAPGSPAPLLGLLLLLLTPWCSAPADSIQVTVSDPFHVVILFQPVTLPCTYQFSGNPNAPIVTWKFKSFCRDRIADAFSPASADSQLNAQLAAGNPGYNPYVECQDGVRTVRVVATKQGNSVTLGDYYQGRRVTITGNADLVFEQTAWGDSGVYYCSVVSAQDLQGNNEAYAELIVLGRTRAGGAQLLPGFEIGVMPDWLFVVVVVLAALLVIILLGVCWCQCCPHSCCCYVRCPCCPQRCCCPEALYAAGKAATSGVPSIYAPSVYAAPSAYTHLPPARAPPPAAMIPMGPIYTGYTNNVDQQSSLGHDSQVPLLRDTDSSVGSDIRSGYRIQANQDDSMRVLYYMEKELANFDPARPGLANGRVDRAMSEVTSLHETESRPHSRPRPLSPLRDTDEDRGWGAGGRGREPAWERGAGRPRGRAHSLDALDDLDLRPGSAESEGRRRPARGRAQEGAYAPRSHSRDDLRFIQEAEPRGDRPRPHHDPYSYQHPRARSREPHYDGQHLEEALRRKGDRDRRRPRRGEQEEDDEVEDEDPAAAFPPPPPPYCETESQSSRERRLKTLTLSRESLVV